MLKQNLIMLLLLFYILGCSNESEEAVILDKKFVSGIFEIPTGYQSSDFTIEVKTQKGEFREPEKLSMDEKGGFLFEVEKRKQIVFHIRLKKSEWQSATLVPYKQVDFKFSNSSWESKKKIAIDVLSLDMVGASVFRISDFKGNALSNAKVSVLNFLDEQARLEDSLKRTGLRPVPQTSDKEGRVRVFPIYQYQNSGWFHLSVQGTDSCRFVTGAQLFKVNASYNDQVTVPNCSMAKDNEIKVIEGADYQVLDKKLQENSPQIIHTNLNQFQLKLNVGKYPTGSLNIQISEGHQGLPGNIIFDKKMANFRNVVEVSLPEKFPTTGAGNGGFTIFLKTSDGFAGHVFGTRKKTELDNENLTKIRFLSAMRVENKMSIDPRLPFSLTLPDCKEGEQLGITFMNLSPVFKDCDNNMARFSLKDFDLPVGALKAITPIKIFFRDSFGNQTKESTPDADKEIEIFGPRNVHPDQTPAWGSDFGILNPDKEIDDLGKVDAPFQLVSLDEVRDREEVNVGFVHTLACKTYESIDTKTRKEYKSFVISQFALTSKKQDIPNWQYCYSSSAANPIKIKVSVLTSGALFLHMKDGAGNLLEPIQIF